MSELSGKLRKIAHVSDAVWANSGCDVNSRLLEIGGTCTLAANELERLQAENAKLRLADDGKEQ